MQDIYTENILEKARDKSFDIDDHDTFNFDLDQNYKKGIGTNPSCGDTGDIYFLLENNIVKDIKLNKEGCAISQAGLVMLSEKLVGKGAQDLKKILPSDIYDMLGVHISPARAGCALLCYNALEDFLKKHATN
jgi:nitrogen fixation NifU-like protein